MIGIWYWCCDQTIVQRVLAAKDDKNARLGPLFCAFLKILPVFLFVLPGVFCVALVQQRSPIFGGEAPGKPKNAYTFMVTHMLPLGLKGLVTAAMLAAAMQTCSAALNSAATLFAYDIVQRYRPKTSDHQLVLVGKITVVVGTVLAIVSSPIFGQKDTVFQALTDIICYISPPVTAVFLFGVFWKRTSGRAAFLSLAIGNSSASPSSSSICSRRQRVGRPCIDWHQTDLWGIELTSMMASFYLLVLAAGSWSSARTSSPNRSRKKPGRWSGTTGWSRCGGLRSAGTGRLSRDVADRFRTFIALRVLWPCPHRGAVICRNFFPWTLDTPIADLYTL